MNRYLFLTLALIIISANQTMAESGQRADTVIANKFGYFVYPYAFYTPETQLALGVGSLMYFRFTDDEKIMPSKALTSIYYTTNNQFNINFEPLIHFTGSRQGVLQSKITYYKEVPKFFGIGNNSKNIQDPDFEILSFGAYAELGGKIGTLENISGGIVFDYSYTSITDIKDNPFLQDGEVLGSNGGHISGAGFLLIYDARDNIFYPRKNGYYKFRLFYYEKFFGSDYSFEKISLDLRQYFTLHSDHILALQLFTELTSNDVPFYVMPELGGTYQMRGVFQGRYRDKMSFCTQAEYRKFIWWKFGIAAFVGFGQVADEIGTFNSRGFKTSYGGGLRFLFDKKENINLRFDVGFSEGETGIYFAIEEAF
jgi:outer membrane protein assembly factor BamA